MLDMEEIEVPQYFICPISLQIMKDPVTTVSGITYDRESIEQWLLMAKDTITCPVTKQPLSSDSGLTPNHMLRRLIQGWCVMNAKNGVDRIPTPKSPLNKSHIFKHIRNLNIPELHFKALKKMEELAENEKNRACMAEAGAIKAMVLFVTRCFKEGKTSGLEEALKILHLIWTPTTENKHLLNENFDLIDSILLVLKYDMENHVAVKTSAMLVLKIIIEVATKAALNVLIEVCPWGRNRSKIVETGAVFELIELELNKPEKHVSELIFCLLAHLCSCADGREKLLKHAGGVAMLAKRILRVSPGTDDRAIHVLSLISKFSATNDVLMEMLRVGAVSKLCMVLQADSPKYLKNKAREVLRLHARVWNNSPCIAVYLLTKDPR
ncbi:E3 ubiquitin-protein ligase PUB24-like isoform X2 [Camellia sinensis]|uniref:E3 ubiquitin-protein ligase PUB24-like isoform X2 n=1 Tax=Camellia sinensis TaxID=4442 RepID=UPI001036D4ED|nr:E3 ubiquitin-protein ligase PUB24-like isoform X2 [Camellia sinensis]